MNIWLKDHDDDPGTTAVYGPGLAASIEGARAVNEARRNLLRELGHTPPFEAEPEPGDD